MSSYQVEFLNKLKLNIAELEKKLTADEKNNLIRSLVNTCYWARALQQTFSDMSDVGMMLAMGASCDFTPSNEADAEAHQKREAELRVAVETVAQRITEANQGK